MTDEEVVREANALARKLYRRMGYVVREGYRFDQATHPQEGMCWDMAVLAFEHIAGTDVESALAECDE